MPNELPQDLFLLAEAPAKYHPLISPRMARKIRENRTVRTWLIGRRVYASAADVEKWLASRGRPARVGTP